MAFDANKPEDQGYLADFPPEMREQLRAIIHDELVNAGLLKGLCPGNAVGNIAVNNGNMNRNLNAEFLEGKSAASFSSTGHTHSTVTPSSNGLMSNTDKAKLDTIHMGAEVNQNAFSNVNVGGSMLQADNKMDTLTITAGKNISLVPDVANDRITIDLSGTVESANVAGKLSAARTLAIGGKITAAGIGFDGTRDVVFNVTNVIADSCTGNAATATKLNSSKIIRLIGDTSGETSFDGSGNATIETKTSKIEDMSSRNGFKELVKACMALNDLFRIGVGGDNNGGYAEFATADDGNEPIVVRQYTGAFQNLIRTLTLLDGNGNSTFPGQVWAQAFHGNADTASNANNLGGQSLQWILSQIRSATTGIVAGNLQQNGWVKFANGLIVQWGTIPYGADGLRTVSYPIAFSQTPFILNTSRNGNESKPGALEGNTLLTRKVNAREFKILYAAVEYYPVDYIALGI